MTVRGVLVGQAFVIITSVNSRVQHVVYSVMQIEGFPGLQSIEVW